VKVNSSTAQFSIADSPLRAILTPMAQSYIAKPYMHDIASCFSDGAVKASFERELAACDAGLGALRAAHGDGSLPLLRLPAETADLAALGDHVERFRADFDHVVVLGTGGSSLGGQTLCALADKGFGPTINSPKLHFMDNVDPDTFLALFAALDLTRTGFIVISKSGGTAETLTQFLACFDAVRAVAPDAGAYFLAITEPNDNVLRRLAASHSIAILDHDPGVGGRFSALSLVGLLPAMIAGLDAHAIRAGASEVLEPILAGATASDTPAAVGAAISVTLNREKAVSQTVLMPYVDRLADFGLWYRQLWAESLGKGGQGTTPIRAVGTVDQHSQLQLYLDGPADKMFTLIMLDVAGSGPVVQPDLADDADLAYLSGRTMGDLMDAEQRATAATLIRNGRPTRIMRLSTLDERVMGALMMHFMVETMLAAHLLGVDAFDQPAVEQGKILTRQYLAESGQPTDHKQ
jgi:glucose-6-phosphate isomerase